MHDGNLFHDYYLQPGGSHGPLAPFPGSATALLVLIASVANQPRLPPPKKTEKKLQKFIQNLGRNLISHSIMLPQEGIWGGGQEGHAPVPVKTSHQRDGRHHVSNPPPPLDPSLYLEYDATGAAGDEEAG